MGDVRNIGMQILDIEKIRKINNGHNITAIGINHTNTDILTYSDFQRYIEKSSVVKKISSGFRVKIGPFSIGRKKELQKYLQSLLTIRQMLFMVNLASSMLKVPSI